MKRPRKVGSRLVAYVLVFALALSLTLSGIQLRQSTQDETLRINALLDHLVASSEANLSDVVWEEDQRRAKQIAENIVKITDVSYFVIRSSTDLLTEVGDKAPQMIERTTPLNLRYGERLDKPFGEFTVGVDMAPIEKRLHTAYWGILARTALLIFLIVGFVLLLFRLMVTRHLSQIGTFFASLTPETLSQRLQLDRAPPGPGGGDEFDDLVNGVNHMQASLVRDIERRELAEAEVRQLNEVLEDRVDQRTAELKTSNIALESSLNDLKATQTQLIQSEKMASLGQLVASVAHEINTPIGAVKSSGRSIADALEQTLEDLPRLFDILEHEHRRLFMKLISHTKGQTDVLSTREERAITREATRQLEEAGINEARHKASSLVQLRAQSSLGEYLPLLRHAEGDFILSTANGVATIVNSTHNINTAVDRVAKIVFALKSFSRINLSGEMIDADLHEGLETVLTIYHSQIRQGTELVRHYEKIAPLRCLPDELNQVWTNLIHNALQAMKHQGTLTVGIRRAGDEAVVSIGDSGCGISEAIRGKIFDAFFTTKPAGEGSGLGLDIVRKIVDKHNGRIDVQSEVGVGTTFLVHLPYATAGQ